MEEVDSDSQQKLRSTAKTSSVDRSESCQELDSLENDKLYIQNSHRKKAGKKRFKRIKKVFSESDEESCTVRNNCVKSDNALKLFPIFTLSNSRLGHKQSLKREPNFSDPEKICQQTKLNKKRKTKIGKAVSFQEASVSDITINSDSNRYSEVFDSEAIKPLNAEILNDVILDIDGHLKQDANPVNDIKIMKKKLTSEEYDILLSADSEENTIKPTRKKRKKNIKNKVFDSTKFKFDDKAISEDVITEVEFNLKLTKNNSHEEIIEMKSERDQKLFPIFNKIKKNDIEELTECQSTEENSDTILKFIPTSESNCSSIELVSSVTENSLPIVEKYIEQSVPNTLASGPSTPLESSQKTSSSSDPIILLQENLLSSEKDLEKVVPQKCILDCPLSLKPPSYGQSPEMESTSNGKVNLTEDASQSSDTVLRSISNTSKQISSPTKSIQSLKLKNCSSSEVIDFAKGNSLPLQQLVSEELVMNSTSPLKVISPVSLSNVTDCSLSEQMNLVEENAFPSIHNDSKGLNSDIHVLDSLVSSKSVQKDCSLIEPINCPKEDLSLFSQNDSKRLILEESEKALFASEKCTSTALNVLEESEKKWFVSEKSTLTASDRTQRKRKAKTNRASAETSTNTRVTRSQSIKDNCSLNQIPTPLSTVSPTIKPDTTELTINKTKKKMKEKKSKPDVLRLLGQSKGHFKSKNKLNSRKRNPTKVFPIFFKTETPTKKNKSMQINTSVQKLPVSKRNNDYLKDPGENKVKKARSANTFKIQSKSVKDTKKRKKTTKTSGDKESSNITEMSPASDDSITEIKVIDSLKNRSIVNNNPVGAHNSKEVNKAENFKKESVAVVNKHKSNFVVFKKVETLFPFPSYSRSHSKWEPDYLISNYQVAEDDLSDEVNIPEWNKIAGLTEIKKIDNLNMKNLTKNISHSDSEMQLVDEIDDALWTDISNDYNLKEGISESTISDLNSWLLQWKSRFTKRNKIKHNESDDSCDSFSADSNDSFSDDLVNSVIIVGPPGCGKTSLVFSLANDHGFKVLEVNASSCRSGRNVNHQLKEALESYHVENAKTGNMNLDKNEPSENTYDAIKSKERKNCNKKSITDFLQRDNNDENKNIKNQPNVKNYFQVKSASSAEPPKTQKNKKSYEKFDNPLTALTDTNLKGASCSISMQTIILFDDIDVVFQEDEGLWSTIRNFLRISKKPVIFTVSRNLAIVKANLDTDIKVLNLKPMVQDLAVEKLNYQYEKNNRKNTNMNMQLLVNNCNDVRRSLLHGQFWSQPYTLVESNKELLNANTFLLGSLNFTAVDFISFLFENYTMDFLNILSDYHRMGYDVLHSNFFTILNVIFESEITRSWQAVVKKYKDPELGTKSESDNSDQTDLWKEACKVFESKKSTFQKGSSSNDLFEFSHILEDFSFIDMLKGGFNKNVKWMSLPERIKKWTLGLPVCSEDNNLYYDDIILEISSLIQVLGLQIAQNKYSCKNDSKQNKKETLVLEHPIMNFDTVNECKVEMQMQSIAPAFSASYLLNKTAFNLDYLSTLKTICHEESLKQAKSGKRSNRFLHYFDSISLFIDKHQIKQLLD
ncbi:ATPase family AAA domain-containing protein 5 [Trichonephila clavata]|uniref:ATPase family AAA domain-containing protein 5 n=1 Tax=Trichonephila clavata TaxID=2740835 RepID=A0A8X6LXI8_TRICU|nr:ATPase family AAA domain-containing protein 5 [Trichonephila clavata]